MVKRFFDYFVNSGKGYRKVVVEMIGWALIWLLFSVCVVYGIVLARVYIVI
jgi:hypothetical protein